MKQRRRKASADRSVHDHDSGEGLVPFEEARLKALSGIEPLPPALLPLREAHGLALAEELTTPRDLPPFPSSAMDGYAVRSSDVAGASADEPVSLRIVGRVEMGARPEVPVGLGEAVEIPTGGAIPSGADAVVPIEACAPNGGAVGVLQPQSSGQHVRPAGEDIPAGGALLDQGQVLGGPELGLIASAGIPEVNVRPRARVGIVSTGDEVVRPEEPAGYGQIYDANAFTLHGAVLEAGGIPLDFGPVPDDPARLLETMDRSIDQLDLMVTSGGVSVGERDPVKAAFGERGDVEFLEVAMQPGKPQAFGRVNGRPYFGLPGNPVSVFVSFEAFVRPAIRTLMGLPAARPEVPALLETELRGPEGKTMFARVRCRWDGERWVAASTGSRQSNLLATVARANGLAIVPAGVEAVNAGETCNVLLFREDPRER
jgi:molybdopterin molybdotransferase